jgi:hypothetical protein
VFVSIESWTDMIFRGTVRGMNEERERRIGLNEAFFRSVNEQIEAITQSVAVDAHLEIVCECGSADCLARLSVMRSEYERIRGEGTLFIALPGHEIPAVEDVVERADGYVVLRKRPGTVAGEVAEATDPR